MVKADNPFDKKLDSWRSLIPLNLTASLVFVHDTLDWAKAIAESIFGDSPPPHVVFDIYRFVISEIRCPSFEAEAEEEDPED